MAGVGKGEKRVVPVSSDWLAMLAMPQVKTLGLAPELQRGLA